MVSIPKIGGTIMTIVCARVDQRLIHGIVVNQWFAELNPKRFMVIDDEVSQNEDLKSSLRLSKPSDTGMSIINTEKAIINFKAGKYDAQRVFVIVKEPKTLLQLSNAGIEIPKVDIGIIFAEDGRTLISKFVSVNAEETQDFQELEEQGSPVNIQYAPAVNKKSTC